MTSPASNNSSSNVLETLSEMQNQIYSLIQKQRQQDHHYRLHHNDHQEFLEQRIDELGEENRVLKVKVGSFQSQLGNLKEDVEFLKNENQLLRGRVFEMEREMMVAFAVRTAPNTTTTTISTGPSAKRRSRQQCSYVPDHGTHNNNNNSNVNNVTPTKRDEVTVTAQDLICVPAPEPTNSYKQESNRSSREQVIREKRKNSSKSQSSNKNMDNINMSNDDDEVVCTICQSECSYDDDPIVFCDGEGCQVAVHKSCYNIKEPIESMEIWRCEPCEAKHNNINNAALATIRCGICGHADGAIRHMADTKEWAHPICVKWTPEQTLFDDGEEAGLIPPSALFEAAPKRKRLNCVLCSSKGGGVHCSHPKCLRKAHPHCSLNCPEKQKRWILLCREYYADDDGKSVEVGEDDCSTQNSFSYQWLMYCDEHFKYAASFIEEKNMQPHEVYASSNFSTFVKNAKKKRGFKKRIKSINSDDDSIEFNINRHKKRK